MMKDQQQILEEKQLENLAMMESQKPLHPEINQIIDNTLAEEIATASPSQEITGTISTNPLAYTWWGPMASCFVHCWRWQTQRMKRKPDGCICV